VDREEILRRDFPIGRRGYDPATVDEHLRRVADQFEAGPSLSGATSEHVRHILEAAERGASELRARAGEEAADHVARVRSAADGMLAKLDELENELLQLLAALRASGDRLVQGLAELQGEVGRGAPIEGVELPVEEHAAAGGAVADEDFAAAAQAPTPSGGDDEAGARLIALNMALSGSSREDTARYLADNFALADPDALLDDVFARAGR
jgi:DivIVA domain-containing protein